MATYVALSGELNVIVSTLIHGMSDEDRDYFNQLITHASSAQLDMNAAITELKLRTEDICETVKSGIHDLEIAMHNSCTELTKTIDGCHKDVLENRRLLVESMTQFKKDIEEILNGDSYKKVINTMFGALRVSADEQFTIATAENLLLSASKSSVEKAAPPEHMQAVKEKVDAFFEDLEKLGIKANCVEKGSVLIEFTCPLAAMTAFINYFCNELIEARMADIAQCLETVIGKRIFILAYIPQQVMDNTLKTLRENVEESRGLKLTMTCTGVEGLVHVWDVFEEGAASNSLNELSKTLSEVMGKPVSLELSIDAEQMKKALQSTKEYIDRQQTANERLTNEQIRQLTVEDVLDYLALLNLHKYVDIFSECQIDGELLLSLNENEEIMTEEFKMRKPEAIKLQYFTRKGRLPATGKPSISEYITGLEEPRIVEVTGTKGQDKELKAYQQKIERELLQPEGQRAKTQHNKSLDDLRNNHPDQLYEKPERTEETTREVTMADMDKEFEASKVKQYQVREFYDHFKTCLPKMSMVVQGVFGTSNEDTFNQGEVVVIVPKIHKGINTDKHGGSDCVEAHFIAEGDTIGERIFLPLDVPELLIAEVTGIKGSNREMWKAYQHQIKSQFTGDECKGDNPHLTDENVIYEKFTTESRHSPQHNITDKRHVGIKETVKTGLKHLADTVHSHRDDKHAASCSEDTQKKPANKSKDHQPPIPPKPSKIPDTVGRPTTKLSDELKEKIKKRDNSTPSVDDYENNIPRQKVTPFVMTTAQKKHSLDNNNETLYQNKDILNVEQSKHPEEEQDYENHIFKKHPGKLGLKQPAISEAGNRMTSEQIKELTVEDVSDYLERLNLHKYVETFITGQVDGELLLSLDEETLTKEFKMKGHEAIKLRKFAKEGHLPAFRKQSLP